MKSLIALFTLIFSSGAILAQTTPDHEDAKSIPVRHWEFDYYNYGVSGGQETVYLNLSMALRYNFDTPLIDVGGEFTIGTTPHDRYDPMELNKGAVLKRTLCFHLLLTTISAEERMLHFMSEWVSGWDSAHGRCLRDAQLIQKERF